MSHPYRSSVYQVNTSIAWSLTHRPAPVLSSSSLRAQRRRRGSATLRTLLVSHPTPPTSSSRTPAPRNPQYLVQIREPRVASLSRPLCPHLSQILPIDSSASACPSRSFFGRSSPMRWPRTVWTFTFLAPLFSSGSAFFDFLSGAYRLPCPSEGPDRVVGAATQSVGTPPAS